MEANLTQKRASLEEKIPDVRKTLDVVEYLQERRVGLKVPSNEFYALMHNLRASQEGKTSSTNDDEDDLDDDDKDDSCAPQPITTTYELNDTLYAEAQLQESDSVYLWLGVRFPLSCLMSPHRPHILFQANVMLSYTLPEAQKLLNARLEAAELNLKNTIEDLEFLREQLTIMEVNTARVYNWDVKARREKRLAEGGSAK